MSTFRIGGCLGVSRRFRWSVLFFGFVAYVFVALVFALTFRYTPVFGTCLFDALVVVALWPRGRLARLNAVELPRSSSSVLVPLSLWPVFWLGTQVTSTFLLSLGVSNGVYADVFSSEVFFYLILTLFLAPVSEELFFRFFLFGHLRRLAPFWVAVGVQALAFAWVHGSGLHWYVGTASGVAFALLYEVTGDVRTSVRFHFVYNALCVASVFFAVPSFLFHPLCLVAFNVATAFVLIRWGESLRRRRPLRLEVVIP